MARTQQETNVINQTLAAHGLGTLDDPGVVAQLGYLVVDHEHFRSLLARCEPALRRDMYEALKPHLRFGAHALDWYDARTKERVEARQYPVLAEDGSIQPFRGPAASLRPKLADGGGVGSGSDVDIAQCAVNRAFAAEILVLTCRKCTKQDRFTGDRKIDCVMAARLSGWGYENQKDGAYMICPDCLGMGN